MSNAKALARATRIREARAAKAEAVFAASQAVRDAEDAYEKAVVVRNRELVKAHGARSDGGLSYDELAVATCPDDPKNQISKGRVVQLVQGKSKYSRAQQERRRVKVKG